MSNAPFSKLHTRFTKERLGLTRPLPYANFSDRAMARSVRHTGVRSPGVDMGVIYHWLPCFSKSHGCLSKSHAS